MGNPIKIMDIAKTYKDTHNCKIDIIGLREGEKLKEKLHYDFETINNTIYSNIFEVITPINSEDKIKINKLVIYAQKYNSVMNAYTDREPHFSNFELKSLMKTEPALSLNNVISWESENNINDALKSDLENYMPGDILVKIDRASMANSLELRAPFLDFDFATFCISLPPHMKINQNKDKIILREAYAQAWTTDIKKRDKQGFGAPVTKWLKNPAVKKLKTEQLSDPLAPIFKWFHYEKIQPIVHEDSYRTWALLVLALWMKRL
jgi:asparagine synthase (glutamine-hydrolysing)